MIPSAQQQAAFDWVQNGSGSAVLEAVAGSGKTTTIIEAARFMKGSVACVAFNKKIALELEARLQGTTAKAMTLHSAGFSAWRKVAPAVKVDQYKLRNLVEGMKVPEGYHTFVTKLVSLAKQSGWCIGQPITADEPWFTTVAHFDLEDELTEKEVAAEGVSYAMDVFTKSVSMDKEVIDFDDMIHAPLYHGAKFWQNDWVVIDEAQDTNVTRRLLVRRMLKPGGRLLAVGDRCQAVFGFTGADSDALDLISRDFNCTHLPLTVSYRCPKDVVTLAQTWVGHIEAHPDAKAGLVQNLPYGLFQNLPTSDLTKADAVLCRYTKPLIAEAYNLIRRGIPCHVEGRDIGRGLAAITNKWVVRTCGALRGKLEEWTPREVAKLLKKKQDARAEALEDKIETLYVIMDQLTQDAPVQDLRNAITKLFGDVEPGEASPTLTLSTVHKSKGREWDRVYLLGRNAYMPSKYAKQAWQVGQEYNLCYVAVTRSKHTLIEVVV